MPSNSLFYNILSYLSAQLRFAAKLLKFVRENLKSSFTHYYKKQTTNILCLKNKIELKRNKIL